MLITRKAQQHMNQEKLQVLLSTMNLERDIEVNNLIEKMNIQSDYLIINQTSKTAKIENEKVITINEFGLSKSRNLAIKNSTEKFIILADDDVKYVDNYEKIILDAYKKYPKADCICFWVESKNKDRRVQRMKNGKIGIFKIMKIASFQITMRREKANKIAFDENFGAGTNLNRGEETIFLRECIRKGYNIRFENIKIGEVNQTESTWFKGIDKEYLNIQGQVFKRIYPVLYPLINLQFVIRKRKLIDMNLIEALKEIFSYKQNVTENFFIIQEKSNI